MRPLLPLLIVLPALAANHRALLPSPQEIHYRDGALPIRGLAIHFPAPPSPEDRFAAEWLSNALGIPIRNGSPGGRAILLRRPGNDAPLPGSNDTPGPDS